MFSLLLGEFQGASIRGAQIKFGSCLLLKGCIMMRSWSSRCKDKSEGLS